MGRVRVQWRSAGKAAVVLVIGLAALQVLPGLLKPPEAPPLAADVGLPLVTPAAPREPAIEIREPRSRDPEPTPRRRRAPHGVSAATAVIGTSPWRRKPKRQPVDLLSHTEKKSTQRPRPTPPPVPKSPPSVPPPAPEPPPAPAPESAPPPADGSVEFAPH